MGATLVWNLELLRGRWEVNTIDADRHFAVVPVRKAGERAAEVLREFMTRDRKGYAVHSYRFRHGRTAKD